MARNEEKQLARLNRLYLQKQREEEARKRPPRPKLDSLNTADDVKKWIPTITRDIDFYVKQMEVPCYPEHVITDFNRRIEHLKGEYRAFLRKYSELCPEDTLTPWADRPYSGKRKKKADGLEEGVKQKSALTSSDSSTNEQADQSFTPLKTPLLDNDREHDVFYAYSHTVPPVTDCDTDDDRQNQPLEFLPILKTNQLQKDVHSAILSKVSQVLSKDSESLSAIYKGHVSSNGAPTGHSLTVAEDKKSESSSKSNTSESDAVKHCSSSILVTDNDNNSCASSVNTNKMASTHVLSLNFPYSDSSSENSDEVT